MKRASINAERIADALRNLRRRAGLTQRQVAERSREFDRLGMGRLLESQVSDFERGRALPSMGSFLNFLAACSPKGDEVDWRAFERSFEGESAEEEATAAALAGTMSSDTAERLIAGISEAILARALPAVLSRGELSRHQNRARQLSADAVELLLEKVFYACHDWIVEGVEPELDKERLRRSVKPRTAGLTDALRAEIARQGLTAGELDARLRWPAGRTARLLAEPSELESRDSLLLCEVLGTTMMDMLPPRKDVET